MIMRYKPFPVILSSPSGGGKTTIKKEIISKSDLFDFSITCTTRPKRKEEIDGKDYYFVSDKDFERMIKNDELIEWAYVHNHRYGTPKSSVMKIVDNGKFPIMTIDVVGAMNVKKIMPNSVLIFVIPPDFNMLVERLKNRGDLISDINIRMNTALKEMDFAEKFDYLVLNEKLEDTVNSVINIVLSETQRVFRNQNILKDFKFQIKKTIESGGVK
ncbi:MAG: guanylate kinase [Elusimicrobiota bacterium]